MYDKAGNQTVYRRWIIADNTAAEGEDHQRAEEQGAGQGHGQARGDAPPTPTASRRVELLINGKVKQTDTTRRTTSASRPRASRTAMKVQIRADRHRRQRQVRHHAHLQALTSTHPRKPSPPRSARAFLLLGGTRCGPPIGSCRPAAGSGHDARRTSTTGLLASGIALTGTSAAVAAPVVPAAAPAVPPRRRSHWSWACARAGAGRRERVIADSAENVEVVGSSTEQRRRRRQRAARRAPLTVDVPAEPGRRGRRRAAEPTRPSRTSSWTTSPRIVGGHPGSTRATRPVGYRRGPASTPVWDTTRGSTGVVIAVVDTGVKALPDLAGRLLPGYDFVNGDSNATDDQGHGTMTAGVIAAAGDNGVGIAGICWTCRILPVKVLGPTGTGSYSDIARGHPLGRRPGRRHHQPVARRGRRQPVPARRRRLRDRQGRRWSSPRPATTAARRRTTRPPSRRCSRSAAPPRATPATRGPTTAASWVDIAAPGCNPAQAMQRHRRPVLRHVVGHPVRRRCRRAARLDQPGADRRDDPRGADLVGRQARRQLGRRLLRPGQRGRRPGRPAGRSRRPPWRRPPRSSRRPVRALRAGHGPRHRERQRRRRRRQGAAARRRSGRRDRPGGAVQLRLAVPTGPGRDRDARTADAPTGAAMWRPPPAGSRSTTGVRRSGSPRPGERHPGIRGIRYVTAAGSRPQRHQPAGTAGQRQGHPDGTRAQLTRSRSRPRRYGRTLTVQVRAYDRAGNAHAPPRPGSLVPLTRGGLRRR